MDASEPATRMRRGYRVVRALARVMLRSHYRRIEVVGRHRVPERGGVLLVANHQNSLVDSLGLVVASPRPASPLAKAPLWKRRLLRPFLDALGAVPVYRPQDAAENEGRSVRQNLETFRACHDRLAAGGAVVLFPEGFSQPRPTLMPLRTGAARIAIDAGVPVAVVPVGLAYEPPTRARRGSLLVRFGDPIPVTGVEPAARRPAIVDVTRRIEEALRGLLVEADSHADLAALHALTTLWDDERGTPRPRSLDEEADRAGRLAAAYRALRERDPAFLEALRADVDAYLRILDLARVPPDALDRRPGPLRVLVHLAREALFAVVVLPLSLLGTVATWPSRALAEVLALRMSRGSEDVWVLGRIASNTMVFPAYVVVAAAAAALGLGAWAGLATLAGLPLLLALHVVGRDHRDRVRGRSYAFFYLAGRRFAADLRARRHALYERLRAAADRVRSPSSGP